MFREIIAEREVQTPDPHQINAPPAPVTPSMHSFEGVVL